MRDVALRLDALTHVFHPDTPNEVRALDGVDLELERGTFTVVLGTNGSGKSSLLNAIAGSLAPTHGVIRLDGRDITGWPESRRARLISRVFQNPFTGTASDLTVAENLALAAGRGGRRWLHRTLDRERRAALAGTVAELGMGLEDRLDTPIGVLSGGQRQALTVLMATMVRPSLLLLDEHTAALDPGAAELVMQLTDDIVRQFEITAIMVTHSMREALDHGSRILMLHHGAVMLDISGAERASITLEQLLALFKRKEGHELADDQLLLG